MSSIKEELLNEHQPQVQAQVPTHFLRNCFCHSNLTLSKTTVEIKKMNVIGF